MPARIFLYIIAAIIGLVLLVGILWSLFQKELMETAMVPTISFSAPAPLPDPAYAAGDMWHARPGMRTSGPGEWLPPGEPRNAVRRPAAVFYLHPTSFMGRGHWNAPLDDAVSRQGAQIFVRGQATAFNGVADIWAPKYRQATFGAFLTTGPAKERAFDAAYHDIELAFRTFLAGIPPETPIILAGHSQGTMHLLRLMREHVAGTPLVRRLIAVYAIGWPVAEKRDMAALGLPICQTPDQTGCLLSWQSFAEPADYANLVSLVGRNDRMVCTNPLTGGAQPGAPASANLGALMADAAFTDIRLEPGKVPARCSADGVLLIGPPPEGFAGMILPGNNYHMFDYALFWANIRADARRRTASFMAARALTP